MTRREDERRRVRWGWLAMKTEREKDWERVKKKTTMAALGLLCAMFAFSYNFSLNRWSTLRSCIVFWKGQIKSIRQVWKLKGNGIKCGDRQIERVRDKDNDRKKIRPLDGWAESKEGKGERERTRGRDWVWTRETPQDREHAVPRTRRTEALKWNPS